ncbi:14671_t:CDS:10 [Ambispora leptoticha]|uniref:14671_t:CDS:1 n=1 Tax=Ambispora leptoticha TaxID=144679 RepID=A0A9N8W7Q2_9GLOM|nr:14671_t:CDS:10 [Ambispora leptoticha]
MPKPAKKITDADIIAINTLQKAKDYSYNGKNLEDNEKTIFDSDLLKVKDADGNIVKNTDGSDKIDEDKLRETVVLLVNLKIAQAELENEKNDAEKNLSKEGNDLLINFLDNRRNNKVSYQLVNTEENGEKRVDKIFHDYQTIQYRRINRKLTAEIKAADAALSSISNEVEKQLKEIEKADKELKKNQTQAEARAYRDKVQNIINALKADLKPGQVAYNILNRAVESQRRIAETVYRIKTTLTIPTLGSIIETAVAEPYSDKKYAHPTYLGEGLPWQMKKLFDQFDRKKLFALIDKKFSSDAGKIDKIKKAFDRMVKEVQVEDAISSGYELDIGEDCSMSVLYDKEIPGNPAHGNSDLILPRNFDEARGHVLNLSDVLYFMHALFPKGTANFSDLDILKPGADALPFADSGKTLDTEHGKSIPEFFWQVYNDPKAIQWTTMKVGSGTDLPFMAYKERVKRMIDTNVKATDRIGTLTDDQPFETFHNFRKTAEAIDYVTLKNSGLVVPYMIENTKEDLTDIDKLQAKKSHELNKLLAINAREATKAGELRGLKDKLQKLKTDKIEHLEAQLEHLGKKITDPADQNKPGGMKVITVQEALAIKSLYHFVKELSKDIPNKVLDPKYQQYDNNVDQEGKNLNEEAIRAFLEVVKEDLKKGEEFGNLSPEEKADLSAINNYIDQAPTLRAGDLENVFKVDVDISENSIARISEIVNYFDKLSESDKDIFFTELKTYVTDKGLTSFPGDTADRQDKINYYFVELGPEHVIGFRAAYEIKHDNSKKDTLITEMKGKKDNDVPLDVSTSGYGDGNDYTEAGVIKYYSEELGGVNHSYKKIKDKDILRFGDISHAQRKKGITSISDYTEAYLSTDGSYVKVTEESPYSHLLECVVQLVEHRPPDPIVVGSSPATSAKAFLPKDF